MPDVHSVLRLTALVLLSCVVPIAIFIGRNNIRAFRREIVEDLGRLFSYARLANGVPMIIPSFELVKYKYEPEANPNRDRNDDPHSIRYYLLPVLIYVVLTILGFYMAFMPDVIPTVSHFAFPLDNSVDSSGAQLLGMLTYTLSWLVYLDSSILDPSYLQLRSCSDLLFPVDRSYAARFVHDGGDLAEPHLRRNVAVADRAGIFGRFFSDLIC